MCVYFTLRSFLLLCLLMYLLYFLELLFQILTIEWWSPLVLFAGLLVLFACLYARVTCVCSSFCLLFAFLLFCFVCAINFELFVLVLCLLMYLLYGHFLYLIFQI